MKRSPAELQRRRLAWLEAAVSTVIIVMVMRALHEGLTLLLLPALLAPMLGWRLRLGGWWQLGLGLLIVLVAFLARPALAPSAKFGGVLGPFAGEVMLAAVGLLLLRGWLANPHRGIRLTLTLALLGATAAGGARLGWLYPALCVLCIGLGLLALREADPVRTLTQGWRLWRPGAVLLMLSGLCGGALALALPPLYETATDKLVGLMDGLPRVGFSEGSMQLGSLEDVWQSDEVVLRLRGPLRDPHLRGSVHRRYSGGRWAAEAASSRGVTSFTAHPAEPVQVEVAEPERGPLFLPLGALPLAEAGLLRRDALGIVREMDGSLPPRYAFQGAAAPVLPPEAEDLGLPEELRQPLAELTTAWQADLEAAPRQRVATLLTRLEQDYIYSLEHRRTPGVDPVLDFLREGQPLGHCEYFASALVLLSRSVGVPARVVRGFRVSERNRWLDQWVVRKSHAHAWAEVWLDGRWEVRDPEPQRSLAAALPTRTPVLAALLDLLGHGGRWLWNALKLLGPTLLGLLLGAWLLRRLWPRLRRMLRRRRPFTATVRGDTAPPLWRKLLAVLQRRQLQPRPGETLEQLASRAESQSAVGAELARLLRLYGDWRYGGQGDAEALQRTLERIDAMP